MTSVEEMPEQVLLDAWYTRYENKTVEFPLLVGVNADRVDFEGQPLMTAMWNRVRINGIPFHRQNAYILVNFDGRYTAAVHISSGGIASVRLDCLGA